MLVDERLKTTKRDRILLLPLLRRNKKLRFFDYFAEKKCFGIAKIAEMRDG